MSEPSNEALAIMLSSLGEKLISNQEVNEKAQNSILEQCVKTNGRVTVLETAKNMIFGGLIITNLIILPTVFILLGKYIQK